MEPREIIETAIAFINAEQYGRAIELLQPLASAGDAEAQFQLASIYYFDDSVTLADAKKLLGKAAQQSHAKALYYLSGISVGRDSGAPIDMQSLQQLIYSAQLGCEEAQRDLGAYYATGAGIIIKDEVEARKWYTVAAENGHVDAQYNLGLMFLNGEGGEINRELSIMLLESAATHGSRDAAGILADIYAEGLHDMPMDLQQSKRWRDIQNNTVSRPYNVLARGEKLKIN